MQSETAYRPSSDLASLNKTMTQIPSQLQSKKDAALVPSASKKDDQRSQRSASCDDRSPYQPFSINESNLLQDDYDSAHASIADWVDLFEQEQGVGVVQSRLGVGACGFAAMSTSMMQPALTPEFELSEIAALPFKLPELVEVSAIDEHN